MLALPSRSGKTIVSLVSDTDDELSFDEDHYYIWWVHLNNNLVTIRYNELKQRKIKARKKISATKWKENLWPSTLFMCRAYLAQYSSLFPIQHVIRNNYQVVKNENVVWILDDRRAEEWAYA